MRFVNIDLLIWLSIGDSTYLIISKRNFDSRNGNCNFGPTIYGKQK